MLTQFQRLYLCTINKMKKHTNFHLIITAVDRKTNTHLKIRWWRKPNLQSYLLYQREAVLSSDLVEVFAPLMLRPEVKQIFSDRYGLA